VIDVADPEPLQPDHPLWDAPNLQISPHMSALGVGVSRTGPGRAEGESVKDGEGGGRDWSMFTIERRDIEPILSFIPFFVGCFVPAYFVYLRAHIVPFPSPLLSVERRGSLCVL